MTVGREDTQFKKGQARPAGAGRKKGTPNKPVTVKLAMKTFTNEQGAEMLAWFRKVLALDLLVPTEKGYLNLIPHQMEIWRESMRYGIGQHAKQAQDTGRGNLIFQIKFPLGTDPDAMERWFEDEAIRRGLIKGGRPGLQAQAPTKDRGKIFNDALLRAVGHKETPPEVKAALQTEDGDELQLVGDEMPPDPNHEPIE